jgi:hypothetical protein
VGIRLGKGWGLDGKCSLPRVNVAYFFVNDNVNGIYCGLAIGVLGVGKGCG